MEISCLVISHKKASIEQIERAWHGDCCTLIQRILSYEQIKECAILLTCNRVEVYVVGDGTKDVLIDFANEMGINKNIVEIYSGDKCLEHILRVASGLESMIVGEDQILGQVREFYNISKKYGGIGEVLDIVFRKAIHVGTKVRKLTNINKGSVSIGSAAVELADRVIGVKGRKVLVIGAGEMGRCVARSLMGKAHIYIANRTFEKGLELAREVGGKAIKFNEIEKEIEDCDVVITATSSQTYIITRDLIERIMEKREKPLLIIDIALPRNVESTVKDLKGVSLYTIDDLRAISEENLKKRLKEVKKAEEIIKQELENLKNQLKDLKANRAISLMYLECEKIKEEEIRELYNKLAAKYGVDESVIPILEDFINSFIKKFLRKPTVRLREAARNGRTEIIDAIEYLFGGEGHGIPETKVKKAEERSSQTFIQRNKA